MEFHLALVLSGCCTLLHASCSCCHMVKFSPLVPSRAVEKTSSVCRRACCMSHLQKSANSRRKSPVETRSETGEVSRRLGDILLVFWMRPLEGLVSIKSEFAAESEFRGAHSAHYLSTSQLLA
eukprot:3534213-Amphidinium_carterae.2